MDCGGCEGAGAHRRWCPERVGRQASQLGLLSERAEDLADMVGSNLPEASNALYRAAGLLREKAKAVVK